MKKKKERLNTRFKKGGNTMKSYLRILIVAAAVAALVAGIICGKKGVFDNLNCCTKKWK